MEQGWLPLTQVQRGRGARTTIGSAAVGDQHPGAWQPREVVAREDTLGALSREVRASGKQLRTQGPSRSKLRNRKRDEHEVPSLPHCRVAELFTLKSSHLEVGTESPGCTMFSSCSALNQQPRNSRSSVRSESSAVLKRRSWGALPDTYPISTRSCPLTTDTLPHPITRSRQRSGNA